ncbi:MAG: aldose epimerase [Verrucomicrobiota bacterium]
MAESVTFQGEDVFLISNEDSHAWIAPQYGARLLRWSIAGQELIVWPKNADFEKVNKVRGGNPILFPFIARHMVNSEIGLWNDGNQVRSMPMHGFARDMPFEVVKSSDTSLTMRLVDNKETQPYYPFSFVFDVTYSLNKNRELRVSLKVENHSDVAMPYYSGHHFYFNVPHQDRSNWHIKIPCTQTARQKPDGNIVFNSKTMVESSFADESIIDRMHIMDKPNPIQFGNVNKGPRFRIRLDHPQTVPWGAVTTWTQTPESDFYCVEPWTGLPNAIHHRHGLRWLNPRETEEAICKIDVEI